MKCPKCGDYQTEVIDSRLARNDTARRRRRECAVCGERWSTIEISSNIGRLRMIVPCDDCYLHRSCLVESSLIRAGSRLPYCSEGKRKCDNYLYSDEYDEEDEE